LQESGLLSACGLAWPAPKMADRSAYGYDEQQQYADQHYDQAAYADQGYSYNDQQGYDEYGYAAPAADQSAYYRPPAPPRPPPRGPPQGPYGGRPPQGPYGKPNPYGSRSNFQPPAELPRSSSVSDVADQMRTSSELYSTIGAIVISVTDFGLHCAVAIWLTMEYWGDHQPFWSFIVLALVANLIGIVAYIARNVGDDAGTGQPSEFSLKLQQRPNECVVVLICAIINTECLCFLTQSETAHTAFRKLDVLRTLLEGVPALFLELAFLYSRGYQGHVIVVVSFGWTIATIILKLLRVLIIVATGRCEREATLQFFKNTRLEDWILTPIYALHWFLLLLLMLFLDFAAFFPHFGQKWLSQQLLALGGYNASLALENTLTNDTRATPATFAALTALANAPSNETKWGMVYASCDVGQACPLAIDTLVSRVLLPAGLPTAESTALARLYLEPAAVDLLDEWGVVHSRLQTCFFVGVSFFVAG